MNLVWRVALTALMLIAGTGIAGCSGPATLTEATMCYRLDSAMRPINPASLFDKSTSDINLSAKVANAPRDTEVRAELFYVKGAAGTTNRLVSASRAIVDGTTYVGFTFTKGSMALWPAGEYRVDIYIKGEKILDLTFSIN
jgi:hypothetical protein